MFQRNFKAKKVCKNVQMFGGLSRRNLMAFQAFSFQVSADFSGNLEVVSGGCTMLSREVSERFKGVSTL